MLEFIHIGQPESGRRSGVALFMRIFLMRGLTLSSEMFGFAVRLDAFHASAPLKLNHQMMCFYMFKHWVQGPCLPRSARSFGDVA